MSRSLPCLRLAVLAALVGSLAVPAPAAAVEFEAHGRLRYRHIQTSDFATDSLGTMHGATTRGTALLRIAPQLNISETFFVRLGLQAADGQVYGDETTLGGEDVLRPWKNAETSDHLKLREAWIQAPVGIGVIRLGRMESHWGLGMLANGGDREEYSFSDASHGDIVQRFLFITRPLQAAGGLVGRSLYLALGADWVETDELTERADGDKAIGGVGSIAWREGERELGVYVAYRHLEKDDGDVTKALAFDLFGHWHGPISDGLDLDVSVEAAYLMGTTEEARFEGAGYPLDVRQFGLVARSEWEVVTWDSGLAFELGWASGDNNTQDGTVRSFKMDPAFKAGSILFEEVLARISARTRDRVRDPELVGTPPKASELLPTNGSVTNAIFVLPELYTKPFGGMLKARVGALIAFAPADVVDAFSAAEAGGFNRNPFGLKNANGLLGTELLGSLGTDLPLGEWATFGLGVQYGIFLPGSALDATDGVDGLPTIHKLRALTDLRW